MQLDLFIDPGEHTGLALFVDKKLDYFVETCGSSPRYLFEILKGITHDQSKGFGDQVKRNAYIEAGYVGKNMLTSLKLAERRGIAQTVVELLGFSSSFVPVKTWQTVFEERTDKKTKELSRSLASAYIGKPMKNDNISDAICMGLYCLSIPVSQYLTIKNGL